MKKNLLIQISFALLICAGLNDQNAYAQEVELITPLSLNSLALTEKAQSAGCRAVQVTETFNTSRLATSPRFKRTES